MSSHALCSILQSWDSQIRFSLMPLRCGSIHGFWDVVVVVVSHFNGTSTPKGSYGAKTGDNDCNVNSSRYSLSTALWEQFAIRPSLGCVCSGTVGWMAVHLGWGLISHPQELRKPTLFEFGLPHCRIARVSFNIFNCALLMAISGFDSLSVRVSAWNLSSCSFRFISGSVYLFLFIYFH